jgi:hypothetical protein
MFRYWKAILHSTVESLTHRETGVSYHKNTFKILVTNLTPLPKTFLILFVFPLGWSWSYTTTLSFIISSNNYTCKRASWDCHFPDIDTTIILLIIHSTNI